MSKDPKLKQILSGWQIFFIVITVVIGSGCFTDYGVVAKTVGPFGLLVCIVIVGFIAICAMEGLSELTQLFPTVNPIVELVHEFVDEDLALCVGISYWYAYACIMAVQVARAASYVDFFVDTTSVGWEIAKIALFYIIVPVSITLLNCFNVRIYGVIESLSGLLKLVMLLVIVFMLYYITGATSSAASFTVYIKSALADSDIAGTAVCLALETIAFSFIGIEAMAVTAFEAKDSVDLRIPSKFMAYAAFWCYFILGIATSLCLDWNTDQSVLDLLHQYTIFDKASAPETASSTRSALIIAALQANKHGLSLTMNVIFIFCALSAANSTLYVSSRILFGLAYMNQGPERRWFNKLASVRSNGVPVAAVIVSALAFAWIPFTQVKHNAPTSRLISWFATSGSFCIFFMWGSLSLAYLRYWFAFHPHQDSEFLKDGLRRKFVRKDRDKHKGYSTLLDWLQPLPAFVGLFGSFLIVWIFSSAFFWGRKVSGGEFIQYYGMPIILIASLLLRKLFVWFERRRQGVKAFKISLGEWWHEFDSQDRLLEAIENLSIFSKPSQQNMYILSDIRSEHEHHTTMMEPE